jgi:sugar/nucleoside kinase (ribokinase family)
MFDVICVGSCTIDCFVKLPVELSKIKKGSKVLIDDIHLVTGGGGTNVAVGLSRLGLDTGFIGEVGEDLPAHMIKQDLEREGVRFLVKQHSRHPTAYSIVLESNGKDRSILVYKGASSYLQTAEIPKKLSTEWFYFASVMGSSFKTMERMAGIAKKKGIKVYFNPSSYMVEQGKKFLEKVLSATTILAMNKEEAQLLLNTKTSDTKQLLVGLAKIGPSISIITDGKKGVLVYAGNKFYSGKANNIKVVDTTGAGDAFGAGFLAGVMLEQKSKQNKNFDERIKKAILLGICNAESVIQEIGAKKGLLRKKDAAKLLQAC